MAAWSHESFWDDPTGDWAGPLAASIDLRYVEKTLQTVLDVGADYLERDEALEAIVAAQVIAWLQGHCGARDAYSKTFDGWSLPSSALTAKAHQALDRIVLAPSELLEWWQETGQATERLSAVKDLRSRIES